ncbi:hypothetical protein ACJQWK_05029 [Exserohilum turcicum]|uniref:LysM domain-containing protein n=1 Tax=Exserohilum turcicum (strain 28A) TaxID=671987 RepID=R0JWH5_EXST2|nr:uncharacterized protein SETTUDRAFT_34628 [Exserohilum turcica Et28A]EOA81859.1 hypothetical protein SETTUDRAFT_34628 [Exserohilum turcica Et28A]
MRANIVLALVSLLSTAEALRRGCRPDSKDASKGWYYTVAGDTLAGVAADFCTTPDVVADLSKRLDNYAANLPAGINLIVPCSVRKRDCRRNTFDGDGAYVFEADDTLAAVAADFCTSADILQQANTLVILNKDSIPAGTVIQVPCSFNW